MVRFILTVPDRLKAEVLTYMLAWRDQCQPGEATIRLVEEPQRRDRIVHTQAPVVATETAAEVPAQSQAAPASPAAVTVEEAMAIATQTDRSTRMYRVIDTASPIGPVPQLVRLYLIDHPNSTCKQVVAATGRGQKSIESALWMLRNLGIVKESARV